ncbi:MAG: SDR family NAD(P)-dependent oxidoreductase [Bacteroidetes bacterium]|nr:SDR family NAD(P)-dependent oxidoreductase [Bacteroidota bacterium]
MNKTVVITGGEGDIALAIKDLLVKDYNVLTPSKRELDVSDVKQVNQYFKERNVDILINNAGYIKPNNINRNCFEEEIKTININLTGVFICSGAVLNMNKNAIIINIGSSAGTKARGSWASYCSSKSGVIMATKCWYDEGVKTICISPGRTKTKMREMLFPNENQDELLSVKDFALVVLRAIKGDFEWGINLDVNINNVDNYKI